jgi:hypothetical protein
MVVRLSALRADRPLLPRRFISVRGWVDPTIMQTRFPELGWQPPAFFPSSPYIWAYRLLTAVRRALRSLPCSTVPLPTITGFSGDQNLRWFCAAKHCVSCSAVWSLVCISFLRHYQHLRYVAPNGRMSDQWRIKTDLEGNICDVIEVGFRNLIGVTTEDHENLHSE